MARKKHDGVLDLLVEAAALLPWWGGVVMAAGIYGLLSHLRAGSGPVAQSIYMVAQYLAPFACLIGAFVSFIRRKKRSALFEQAVESPDLGSIERMSWRDFEMLVGEAFRLQGYSVEETGGGGPDDGVDLLLWKDGRKHIVQCKHWKTYRVGVEVIREQFGILNAVQAERAFIVTSGRFTEAAQQFAKRLPIQLIDGLELRRMMTNVQTQKTRIPARGEEPLTPAKMAEPSLNVELPVFGTPQRLGARTEPDCPRCQRPMVLRVARAGSQAGKEFWGCSTFPACRGTKAYVPDH